MADLGKALKDAVDTGKKLVDQGKDLVDKGKDTVNKGKDTVNKGKDAVDKGKDLAEKAENAPDKVNETIDKAAKTVDKVAKSITGKTEKKEKKEEEEDPVIYKKMIPSFHFYVSFVKDDEMGKYEAKGFKKAENLPPGTPFSEVSGLSLEIQTEDFQEGGGNGYTIRLPKPPKAKNLVLKRALAAVAPEDVAWARNAVESFQFETRTVLVSILDYSGEPVKTWNFERAYPVKLSLSDLGASKNEIVIETLELAYMRFSLMENGS